MKEFGLQFLLMAVGACLVLWGKAVLKSRSDGDNFNFLLFLEQNFNRVLLMAFGLLVVALGMYLDPIGIAAAMNTLPIGIQLGSPIVIGVAVSGAVLIIPENKPK
jgi:uncharacterized membrane protein